MNPQRITAGITIRNGSIVLFQTAINLKAVGSSIGSIVEGIRIVDAVDGIIADGIIRENTITNTHADGAPPPGNGIVASDGSLVTANIVSGDSVGITVDCPSIVTDNAAVGNTTNLVLNGKGCRERDNVAR